MINYLAVKTVYKELAVTWVNAVYEEKGTGYGINHMISTLNSRIICYFFSFIYFLAFPVINILLLKL